MKDMQRIKPTDSHRHASRLIWRGASKASLATVMGGSGHPYASLVTVATDHVGCPLLLLSTLADHTRNLMDDARVSLLFDDSEGHSNPQEGARVTVLGRVDRTEDPVDRDRFLARHPGAALYAGFGDFTFYRVTPERVHYVGGFAKAVWIDDGALAPAGGAELMRVAEEGILSHMNADHADALALMAKVHLREIETAGNGAESWRMTACDTDGFDIRLRDRVRRLAFPKVVHSAGEAREALVALTQSARGQSTQEA
ncbi:HugZ family protein [Rhodospirillum sp. A1_3_36]|uniref:HugZ family pyridoxamine 5'-phosphate oxidase n=1 Tax=Rhodospirillum sp. A1_3_36 TaxID=3391666 RepID=UPI0039A49A3C